MSSMFFVRVEGGEMACVVQPDVPRVERYCVVNCALCASPKPVAETYVIAEPLAELVPNAVGGGARNPPAPPTSPPFLSGGDTSSYTLLSGSEKASPGG